MKKEQIRTKVAKDALIDASQLAKSLKENTENTVKNILSETVKTEFDKIINEAVDDDEADDDYDVTDTEDEDTSIDDSDTDTDDLNSTTDDDSDDEPDDDSDDDSDDEDTDDDVDADDEDVIPDDEDDEPDGADSMNDFEQYKVGDGEYDLTNAEDDDIVKVYKLLKNDDQVMVTKNNGKVDIKDNETGEEYLVDMGDEDETPISDSNDDSGEDFDSENDVFDDGYTDDDEDNLNNMKESRIYEIALNEYNSNVGYTDDYQNKDVVKGKNEYNVNEPAPGKVNDWDKGLPKGTNKPWAHPKKNVAPFNAGKGRDIDEETGLDGAEAPSEPPVKEANLSQSRWNDTHAAHNRVPAANSDKFRRNGIQKTSKGASYRANGGSDETNESVKKMKQIFRENKELKAMLPKFKKLIAEAALTNINLGNIVKILVENTTTVDEKKAIVGRFSKEATTAKGSRNLYESISKQLSNKKPINEAKIGSAVSAAGSKQINETKIYESNDMNSIKDLMNRMSKL